VNMGVAKARNLMPLKRLPISINPKALIIGGGLAGMTAALSLADAGHEVYLIEKENVLGGNLRNIFFNFDKDPQELLNQTINDVSNNKLIHLHKNVTIEKIDGYVGNFKTIIKDKDSSEKFEFEHGIVLIATGAVEHETVEYQYGESSRIVTQVELEEMMHRNNYPKQKMKNIVMIQCVGSREDDKMYCSRVCCTKAVKNALNLKKKFPNVNIYIAFEALDLVNQ